jgi:hypothetical protein
VFLIEVSSTCKEWQTALVTSGCERSIQAIRYIAQERQAALFTMSKHGTPIHNTRAASRYTPQEQQAAIVTSERQAAITKSIPEISELQNKSDKPL